MKNILIYIGIGIIMICLVNGQINNDQAINSCSSLGYTQPRSAEDCKPGGINFQCCYVEIPEKGMKFCSYLSGTINQDIISQFKSTLDISTLTIQCNQSHYAKVGLFLLISLLFL